MKKIDEHLKNIRENVEGMRYADLRENLRKRIEKSVRDQAIAAKKEMPVVIVPEEHIKKTLDANDDMVRDTIKVVLAVLELEEKQK